MRVARLVAGAAALLAAACAAPGGDVPVAAVTPGSGPGADPVARPSAPPAAGAPSAGGAAPAADHTAPAPATPPADDEPGQTSPPSVAWAPSPAEVEAEAKQAAAAFVLASHAEVVYAQLGGLLPDAVSVLVVAREDGGVTRTLDVRLRREAGAWAVEGVADDGGAPVEPGSGSPTAEAVLASPRIALPDSARWDIARGDVDDRLLAVLLDIAERHDVAVSVLRSGHPVEIFGTDRTSDHTRGIAVDVYAVDGDLVVEQRAGGTPAHDLARWLYERGDVRLGSPWAFDGRGGRSFTDPLHQDHLHIALRRD
jgi:hypothetical protein